MCEPCHSVVQYDVHNNDDDQPFSGQSDPEQRVLSALGSKIASWGRRIGNWFHLSSLGSGHDRTIRSKGLDRATLLRGQYEGIQLRGVADLYVPKETKYEGFWWDRRFAIDGSFSGHEVDRADALRSAEAYHNEVVMGSMSKFRRFFETSIEKSDQAYGYVTRLFDNVLTHQGRDLVQQRLRQVFGRAASVARLFGSRVASEEKARATKVVMGFTRKRGLFLPHWADDDRLWTPGQ